MSDVVRINNNFGEQGGIAINANTATVAGTGASLAFARVRVINGANLVISAITGGLIDYSTVLPITLTPTNSELLVPGATSVTATSGQGVALYR